MSMPEMDLEALIEQRARERAAGIEPPGTVTKAEVDAMRRRVKAQWMGGYRNTPAGRAIERICGPGWDREEIPDHDYEDERRWTNTK